MLLVCIHCSAAALYLLIYTAVLLRVIFASVLHVPGLACAIELTAHSDRYVRA